MKSETYQFTVETTTSQGRSHTLNVTVTTSDPSITDIQYAIEDAGYIHFVVKSFNKKEITNHAT